MFENNSERNEFIISSCAIRAVRGPRVDPSEPQTSSAYYFGGARSKGFATLRNVSKLQFFDKIGQAKSVGFRLYSVI